jgi:hypothetical protein
MRRLLASFLMLWVAVLAAEPAALHACAMHDGAGAAHHGASANATTSPDEHSAHTAHASSEVQASHGVLGDRSQDAPAPSVPGCSCVGDCSAAALTPLVAALVTVHEVPGTKTTVAVATTSLTAVTTAGLVLPFANAPPLLPPTLS